MILDFKLEINCSVNKSKKITQVKPGDTKMLNLERVRTMRMEEINFKTRGVESALAPLVKQIRNRNKLFLGLLQSVVDTDVLITLTWLCLVKFCEKKNKVKGDLLFTTNESFTDIKNKKEVNLITFYTPKNS